MIWFKYLSNNIPKIYKYIFQFKYLVKKHSWNKLLNNIKINLYLNKIVKKYKSFFVVNKVLYFFYNYNVNFRIKKKKMRFLIFIKKKIFLPSLSKLSKVFTYITSLKLRKNNYKQILYWYYSAVRPIKFNSNQNDLFKFFNNICIMVDKYSWYLEGLTIYSSFISQRLRIKTYFKIYKLFNYFLKYYLKILKNFKNIKYIIFSFNIKKKYKKIFLKKQSNYFLKNKINILLVINNIIYYLFLFLIKNWLDINIKLVNISSNNSLYFDSCNYYLNNNNNIKIINYLIIKYRIAWKVLYKITYVKYFRPLKFIIKFKKLNYF